MTKKATAFEKRVKRHILSKKHDFFISVSPGFTDICFEEIQNMDLEADNIKKIKGGIEFNGTFNDCYKVNLFSRTANRVLLRTLSFKATNFKSMGKKISSFPWELYLNPQVEIDVSVTSKKSRLIHSDAIKERAEELIYEKMIDSEMDAEFDDSALQKVFIRVIDDNFTISIDATGENLYKRDIKNIGGPAPIRETIASSLLFASGFTEDTTLIDPMCGSGTFSFEAYMIACSIPPGIKRSFSFEKWPGYKEARFNHIRKKASEKIKKPDNSFIFASDRNGNIINEFKKSVSRNGFDDGIEIEVKDFFKFNPELIESRKALVIFNPPFGHRIGSKKESNKLLKDIVEKLKKDYKGYRFGLILPFKDLSKKIPFKCRFREFSHGGLKLIFASGTVDRVS